MTRLFNKPKRFPKASLVLLHIGGWIAVVLFYTFLYGRFSENYTGTFAHMIITLPAYIFPTYFTLYLLIPKYLLRKNYKSFFFAAYYLILGVAFYELLIIFMMIILPADSIPFYDGARMNSLAFDVLLRVVGVFVVVFLASIIKLLKHSYDTEKITGELAKEKLEAELRFLKSQVHPHFLFNTLNNLYALTLKKSDDAPEVVLKLSELLDFMLYQCEEDLIPIEKEIELIENYITLEKLRYGERLKFSFEKEISEGEMKIAPLLLLPFVENAFKHGPGKVPDQCEIEIILKCERGILRFSVSNDCLRKKESIRKGENGSLGLKNIRQRLDLIYREEYELDISEIDGKFSVNLMLKNKKG